jgi:hypothetical protein
MRVGVVELLNPAISTPWPEKGYAYVALKQNASIMPQAVSVWCRDLGMRQMIGRLPGFIHQMKTDPHFRASHKGETQALPQFYHRLYDDLLGPYAALLSEEDRQPQHQRVGRA